MEDELITIIEKVFKDNRELKNSKEYILGNSIYVFGDMVKKFDIKGILKKVQQRKKNKLKGSIKSLNDTIYPTYEGEDKIAVYTCITGKYDELLEPIYNDPKCDYFIFTDNEEFKTKKVIKKNIPEDVKKINNAILENRYIKMHPYELFDNKKYRYAIYIDGNIQPVTNISSFVNKIDKNVGISMHSHSIRKCIYEEAEVLKLLKKGNINNIDKQMEKYRSNHYPVHNGLAEANVIVSDLKNDNAIKIFQEWWKEFLESASMRDQLSLPYVVWKCGYKMDQLISLGKNVYDNPKIVVRMHK